jgi:hypothetical protein
MKREKNSILSPQANNSTGFNTAASEQEGVAQQLWKDKVHQVFAKHCHSFNDFGDVALDCRASTKNRETSTSHRCSGQQQRHC